MTQTPNSQPELKFVEVPGPAARDKAVRRLAWWDWSSPAPGSRSHAVLCVHGLSRQGRDFDVLARALLPHSRVVAVDVAGRGHSDWLADPLAYQIPTYVSDLMVLMAQLRREGVTSFDWVGTSMGGLIGLGVAAQPGCGLRRLVLNDVGPVIEWTSLQRIATYLGKNMVFDSTDEAVAHLARISPGFGPHTPEQWRALSLPMLRQRAGRCHLHYDPALSQPVQAMMTLPDEVVQQTVAAGEAALWAAYDSLTLPTLLLRGAESDLLSVATARAMAERGPRAQVVEFAGVGHAPTLVAENQVAAVLSFLCGPS